MAAFSILGRCVNYFRQLLMTLEETYFNKLRCDIQYCLSRPYFFYKNHNLRIIFKYIPQKKITLLTLLIRLKNETLQCHV
jgi:hypothetical protein